MVQEIVADGMLYKEYYGIHGTCLLDNIMIMYGTLQNKNFVIWLRGFAIGS